MVGWSSHLLLFLLDLVAHFLGHVLGGSDFALKDGLLLVEVSKPGFELDGLLLQSQRLFLFRLSVVPVPGLLRRQLLVLVPQGPELGAQSIALVLELGEEGELLLSKLCKVDDGAEVSSQASRLGLVEVLDERKVVKAGRVHELAQILAEDDVRNAVVVELRKLQAVDGVEDGLLHLLARDADLRREREREASDGEGRSASEEQEERRAKEGLERGQQSRDSPEGRLSSRIAPERSRSLASRAAHPQPPSPARSGTRGSRSG